jgi:N-acetyl-alpha-D-muramate 1-phosphate uridylyltransferase
MRQADLSDFPVAILAGGLATRLGKLARNIPKSLLTVAGKPFLAHQLALLRDQGIKRVVLCVGHLGKKIQSRFGDGADFGLELEYSYDGPNLIGTGGAVRKALSLLGEQFFVMYGDSYLPIDFHPVAAAFWQSEKSALMTVLRNENRWDTSNVRFENGKLLEYSKQHRTASMHYIDYGLSIFSERAFTGTPQAFDLSKLVGRLVAQQEMEGYEVQTRFYEIGSPGGLAELEKLLTSQKALVR